MANFSRTLQKANLLDSMRGELARAELAESRAVFIAACYEAVHGPLGDGFFNEVHALIRDAKVQTKGEFYNAIYNAAKTVHTEREFAAATADLKAREASEAGPDAAQALADTLNTLVLGEGQTPPPGSDTSDT